MPHRSTLTIGVDVSDKNCHLAVLDDNGAVILRDRCATKRAALSSWLRQFPPTAVNCIALEVGPHSPWMSRHLVSLGYEAIVGNPRKIALISGHHTKSDVMDAETLARLARVDPKLLSPVEHRSEATQAARAILRSRDVVVRSRTQLINTVKGQAKAVGTPMTGGSSSAFHHRTDELPEVLADALSPLMTVIGQLTKQIHHYDKVIDDMCESVHTATQLLTPIYGVGNKTALAFVLTIEVPERFRNSRAVGSYLGLRPRRDQSGDSDRQLRITKAGDPLVRRLLVQCAHRLLSENAADSDLKRWGLRLADRGGKSAKKRAVVAVARKLAVLMHRLWVAGEVYDPLYQARKHDPELQPAA